MKRVFTLAAATAALALGGSVAMAESFVPHGESSGMSWRAWHSEAYNNARSAYRFPGGDIPGQAHVAPGLVYGGGPAAPAPGAYDPYYGAPAYAPVGPYPPAPPGY